MRILIITTTLSFSLKDGLAAACRGIIFGDATAELCSCGFLFISFLIDNKLHLVCKYGEKPPYKVLSRLSHIALPITAGRYLNSLLRTAENVLVPRQLEKFGMTGQEALSLFGAIKGMALPLIFFPATFLNALSTLLIPEMSEAAAQSKAYKVRYTAEKCIHVTLIASLPFAVIFFFAGDTIGTLVYKDPAAGQTVRLLAPIVPLMYLDSVCDGLLKGLDEQFSLFRNSLIDSLCRIGLIILILPKFGFMGFIGIMFASNLFTCLLNLLRLAKISKARILWGKWFLLPLIISALLGVSLTLFLSVLSLNPLLHGLIFTLSLLISYLFLVFSLGCIRLEDFK